MRRCLVLGTVALFVWGCDMAGRTIYRSLPEDVKEHICKVAADVPGNAFGLDKQECDDPSHNAEDSTVTDSLE